MSKDLLYRPDLGYKKDYYTEGKFNTVITTEEDSLNDYSNGKDPVVETIDTLQEKIENNFNFLPSIIIDSYLSPFYGMKDEYDRLKDKIDSINNEKDKNSTEVVPGIIVTPDNDEDDLPPQDPFAKGPDIKVTFEDEKENKEVYYNKKYWIDFIDIYKEYLTNIDKAIDNFVISTLDIMSTAKLTDEVANYSTTSLKNKNLSHLSDYVIKSDILLQQATRLHKKLFDTDETILHIRGVRISNEQRIRYSTIKQIAVKDSLDINSNMLLKESQKVSEKKYEENFYSLYKYLNSSVILLTESTKSIVKQTKCLVAINRYEERE